MRHAHRVVAAARPVGVTITKRLQEQQQQQHRWLHASRTSTLSYRRVRLSVWMRVFTNQMIVRARARNRWLDGDYRFNECPYQSQGLLIAAAAPTNLPRQYNSNNKTEPYHQQQHHRKQHKIANYMILIVVRDSYLLVFDDIFCKLR